MESSVFEIKLPGPGIRQHDLLDLRELLTRRAVVKQRVEELQQVLAGFTGHVTFSAAIRRWMHSRSVLRILPSDW